MIKKQKNVVVNYLGRKGGGALYSYEMTKGLLENGCRVYAIIAEGAENVRAWQALPLEGLCVIPTYRNIPSCMINTVKFRLNGLKKLKEFFDGINIDVLYIPMVHPWAEMVNSIFPGSRKIVTIHDPILHSGTNLLLHLFSNNTRLAVQSDDVVILSNTFCELAEKKFKKSKQHIHVIPHGIFDYYKAVETSQSIIQYDADKINFLFFGRITKYKGLHVLSQAYERLSKEFSNMTLSIVGNGDFAEYRAEYNRLKNITIVNRWIKDEEVGCFFKGNNIVTVLPYTDATQSGVIPIAMEYKSLVIAANTGGLSEQVQHGKTGYLFEANNVQTLYEVMKYVIEQYSEQERILQQAHAYIHSLAWGALAKKLVEIIE